jgi:uncharacterized membrane protein
MRTSSSLFLSLAVLTALPSTRAAVDFDKDVKPILENNCVRCHNPKGADFVGGKTDLDLTTHETATDDAGIIIAGDADGSKLYKNVTMPDTAEKLMPPKNKKTGALERLTKEETEILKNWINEGAVWPAGEKLIARKAREEAAGDGASRPSRR